MTEAVIVSTARTAVGKAYRGALNNTEGPTMAGHVIAEAIKRANIAPDEVEDVVMGCAMQQGTMVMNVARKGAIRAGLPVTVAGTTIDRQCASGLQAIAVAARSVMLDGVDIAVGGGIESISLVQNEHMNQFHAVDNELMAMKSEMYMSMLETAEVVAERYKIGRDRQDEYSHQLVVDGVELIHVLVLHQADRFNAATDGDIDTIQHDRSGRNRNRLQARSALPVDCGSCHGDRQSRADRALAGDIHHQGALLHRAAHHDVLDFVRRNVGALDRLCDHMPRHGRPLGVIEGAAISLADGRAGRGYDYCFSHLSPLSWSKLTIRSVLLRIAQYVIGGITELDI